MKKILVRNCAECLYRCVQVDDFRPPWPKITNSCTKVAELKLRHPGWLEQSKLKEGYPEWCPLEDA